MLRKFQDLFPRIAENTYVDETALIIGDVSLGAESSVWPMAVIRGDVNSIHIGHHTNIQDGSILHVTHKHEANPLGFSLNIGNHVTIGHQAILHGCTIEDYCLLGMGANVMDGAHLQEGVFLGAGSLVPPGKTLEGGYLWVGSPAKKVRPLTQAEKEWLAYSAAHYCRLKNQYL